MFSESEMVGDDQCCQKVKQAKNIREILMCHLLEVIVPVDEIILSRTQSPLLLEKSSLGLPNGLRAVGRVLGKTTASSEQLGQSEFSWGERTMSCL